MNPFIQLLQTLLIDINHQLTPSGCIAVAIIFLMILFVMKLQRPQGKKKSDPKKAVNSAHFASQADIQAIAGDDEMTTQLDLARAYIEMGQKPMAQKILSHVAKKGNAAQKQAAKILLCE